MEDDKPEKLDTQAIRWCYLLSNFRNIYLNVMGQLGGIDAQALGNLYQPSHFADSPLSIRWQSHELKCLLRNGQDYDVISWRLKLVVWLASPSTPKGGGAGKPDYGGWLRQTTTSGPQREEHARFAFCRSV